MDPATKAFKGVAVVFCLAAFLYATRPVTTDGGKAPATPPTPVTPVPPPRAKPTLLLCTTPGCQPCARLKAELRKPQAEKLHQLVDVREATNQESRRLGVRAFPTLVVLDAGGKEVGRREGFLTVLVLIEWLLKLLADNPLPPL